MQTIYNAITNGTPCVVVEGSGRVADVIAQVASLPVSEITISLVQQKLSLLFQEMFETFTEGRVVEWTKKVRSRHAVTRPAQRLLAWRDRRPGTGKSPVGLVGEGQRGGQTTGRQARAGQRLNLPVRGGLRGTGERRSGPSLLRCVGVREDWGAVTEGCKAQGGPQLRFRQQRSFGVTGVGGQGVQSLDHVGELTE